MKIDQARKYALSLPETTEEPHFEYTSFRVRGKIFATAPLGDEYLNVFVDEDERAPLVAAEPHAFEALRWGKKVVGIKVALALASQITIDRLLLSSWKRKAPKRLVAAFSDGQP